MPTTAWRVGTSCLVCGAMAGKVRLRPKRPRWRMRWQGQLKYSRQLLYLCFCSVLISRRVIAIPRRSFSSGTERSPPGAFDNLIVGAFDRFLALPAVIAKTFGRPSAIFAPILAAQKNDDGEPYDYVRPLASIEPTAISLGLPVHASIGVDNIDDLKETPNSPPTERHSLHCLGTQAN